MSEVEETKTGIYYYDHNHNNYEVYGTSIAIGDESSSAYDPDPIVVMSKQGSNSPIFRHVTKRFFDSHFTRVSDIAPAN
ncbi:MAG: hypothetical protein Q8P54_01560 [bacterium]|nr:hypothetical protein [bacterium]